MKMTRLSLWIFVAAPLWSACSSSTTEQTKAPVGGAGAASDANGPTGAGGGAMQLGPYPDGPYGNAVGDVLGDLKLQGYLNEAADAISNTKPFVDAYSLEDVRATGAKYALVHVSEFF